MRKSTWNSILDSFSNTLYLILELEHLLELFANLIKLKFFKIVFISKKSNGSANKSKLRCNETFCAIFNHCDFATKAQLQSIKL